MALAPAPLALVMTERKRWGKAGVRLTEEEANVRLRSRLHKRHLEQEAEDRRRAEDERIGRELWAAGKLDPALITFALDAKGLYGPEVDRMCLAEEPDVDLWEEGKRYPTWEQVCALARLTGVTVRFLMRREDSEPIEWPQTSMRFHVPARELARYKPPPREFDPEAVRATLEGRGPSGPDQPALF